MNVTVVIPTYNEGDILSAVIKACRESILVNKIIVVDDGSDAESKKFLKSIGGDAYVITHNKNRGKSEAMKSGVLEAKDGAVIFLDADLLGLKGTMIDEMTKIFLKNKLRMLLAETEKNSFYADIFRVTASYTGERVLLKKDLLANIDIFDKKGYLIEAEMNKVFKNSKIGKVKLMGVRQIPKYLKFGMCGFVSSVKMTVDIIQNYGMKELLSQVIAIEKMRYIKNLY